jgi:hypothetical protein
VDHGQRGASMHLEGSALRSAVFCAVCGKQWNVGIPHSGRSLCETHRKDTMPNETLYPTWQAERAACWAVVRDHLSITHDDLPLGITQALTSAAAALGRKGGSVKSERKAAASRLNGLKGGWSGHFGTGQTGKSQSGISPAPEPVSPDGEQET